MAIVDVPARGDEPGHQHADLRFLLATGDPEAARPENPEAPLRWLTVPEASAATAEGNVRELLARAGLLLAVPGPPA